MPPKSRRKGPAHQNSFAFKHNPNSKLTAKIMAMPVRHVCRRCHDKLEWRKQYRKYKPRTQPGKCNCCLMKRVTAAYHTICEPCTRQSSKARALLDEWNSSGPPLEQAEVAEKERVENDETQREETKENSVDAGEQAKVIGSDKDDASLDDNDNDHDSKAPTMTRVYRRICAMCAKEPALLGEHEEDVDDEFDEKLKNLDRPLRLRERKRLERMAEKKVSSSRQRKSQQDDENEEEDDNDDVRSYSIAEEEEDPLLQSVGGADQLLTGEAYQAKLLQQANQT